MKTNDAEMALLFSYAEQARECLVPFDRRTRESLRRRVECGDAVRPARGMYARASYWQALSRGQQVLHVMRTLQSRHPDWTFCHESAALAYGLPVSISTMDAIHVATTSTSRAAASGIVQRHLVQNDEPSIVQGLRVTSLDRTVFDCLRTADFRHALAVADGALRLSGDARSSFIARFKRIGANHEGINRAIRTMHYADAQSESGGESIARAVMIERGFAIPRLQVTLARPLDSRRTFRVDFLWMRLDGGKVIGELDGMRKYEDAALRSGRSPLRVLADEQHRESQLTLYGMPIVRFSYRDVMNESYFVQLLKRYGVPQSDDIARAERRLIRKKSPSALLFAIEPLPD